jgi:uncharacterized protein (DUF433 family)
MQLEDYFDFLAPDDIRVKGHRIGIETILDAYLHEGLVAEQIQGTYPTLTLEEVYATILYYLHNRDQVEEYLASWAQYCDQVEVQARQEPSPAAQRLLALREKLGAPPPEERHALIRGAIARGDPALSATEPVKRESA